MSTHRAARAAATARIGLDAVALAVSLRRRRAFDTPLLRGSRERVGRDWVWAGTALCPPAWTVAAQAWSAARLARHPGDRGARWVLVGTAASLVPGYLLERLGRARLTRAGADPVETPLVAAGVLLAAATAALGARAQAGPRP
ncbi:hypothetical protein ACI8AC_11135 [Geodermatophilus sp. SYSU D00758]